MKSGEMYSGYDEDLFREQWRLNDIVYEYNQTRPSDKKNQRRLLESLLGGMGENCIIEPPFHASWGKNVFVGENFYANFNLTVVDDADIRIGNDVMIAPNVTIATATHPLDAGLRKQGMQSNRAVAIGDRVWIGAGAVILPGVTIGENTVIGAGSVVTRDIPANVVAFGNPCRVQKEIPTPENL